MPANHTRHMLLRYTRRVPVAGTVLYCTPRRAHGRFDAHDIIIAEGSVGESMFIIERGRAAVSPRARLAAVGWVQVLYGVGRP